MGSFKGQDWLSIEHRMLSMLFASLARASMLTDFRSSDSFNNFLIKELQIKRYFIQGQYVLRGYCFGGQFNG